MESENKLNLLYNLINPLYACGKFYFGIHKELAKFPYSTICFCFLSSITINNSKGYVNFTS